MNTFVHWTAGEPPWTDGDALLFQVDLADNTTQTFIGRVDDSGMMVDLDYGDDYGWRAKSVDRWVLLSTVLDCIEEAETEEGDKE